MSKVHVPLGERSYDIHIYEKFDNLAETALSSYKDCKIMVAADSNVDRLYSEYCIREIKKAGAKPYKFIFPAGEENKNLNTVNKIYRECLKNKLERGDVIIALGGGVTGDVAGFAAATYLRGIHFIQVPTTVLAQCDSSIGGKVGVDFDNVKNIIGSFYQPNAVYINISTLKTLPEREYYSGFGEIVKHAIIRDQSFFEYLENNIEKIKARDIETLNFIVERNCKIKAAVVEVDEKESGLREILNFGHTIGHAVESEGDFKRFHGECIAIGMVGICDAAVRMGLFSAQDFTRIVNLLYNLELPVAFKGLDADEIYSLMLLDKKVKRGKINYIIPVRIGEVKIVSDVDENIIKATLQDIL